jgi:DNA-binding NarL/FixJ family response regulator
MKPRVGGAATNTPASVESTPARQNQQKGTFMSARPRVLVADDHRAMLDSLVQLLSPEFDVVAAVSDGLSAVTEATKLEPDLLVLDIAMPGLNGIAAATRLKNSGSTAKIVFVTNLRDREFVEGSLALGDVGFVVKDRLVADLLPAIRQVLAGQTFISPSVSR